MTSLLHLKSYAFTQLSIKAIPNGNLTVEPKLDVSINYTIEEQNERRVQFGIRIDSSDKGIFGYEVIAQIEALISVNVDYPIQNVEQAACINSVSILFSAAREIILTLTGRCIPGPLFLPTVSFVDIINKMKIGEKSK